MKNRLGLTLSVLALSLSGCSTLSTPDASQQLSALLDEYGSQSKSLDSSQFGIINDQMAGAEQTLDRLYLSKLLEIDRSALSDEEKVYYDTFQFDRTIAIRGASFANARFGNLDVPVTHFYNYISMERGRSRCWQSIPMVMIRKPIKINSKRFKSTRLGSTQPTQPIQARPTRRHTVACNSR